VRIAETEQGQVIRIEWRSNWTSIRPRIDVAVRTLSSCITIRPDGRTDIDLSASTNDRQEQESRVLYLAERGQMMDAITLVQQLYGYSLTEARRFVEELLGRKPV
jgi:hypothetical protein